VIEVGGKTVLTELHELVDPARAAVVVVDMQRDFVEPDGLFGSLGIDLDMYAQMRPRLAALLGAARRAGVRVLHLRNTSLPDGGSDSPAQIRFNLRMHESARDGGPPLRYTVPGTRGYEFVEDVGPEPGEVVVQKFRSSGFWGTNLDLLLRSNGIETVIMGGCTTEGCVDSTARDAMFANYYVVIPTDCVASDDKAQHEAALLLMQHRFDVVTSDRITAVWDGGAAA
jgi:nicotinamidase-related amidase